MYNPIENVWVRKPSKKEIAVMEAQPTWEHESGTWPAHYDERQETFYVISGEGFIEVDGKKYYFEKGDLVTCKTNFDCMWNVTSEKIKKHYIFNADID